MRLGLAILFIICVSCTNKYSLDYKEPVTDTSWSKNTKMLDDPLPNLSKIKRPYDTSVFRFKGQKEEGGEAAPSGDHGGGQQLSLIHI